MVALWISEVRIY